MTILIDTREPWPHPWQRHLPEAEFRRAGLETGDIALAGNPGIVIERKTTSDFLGSITAGRDRFEAELKRSRMLDFFCIVIEGTLLDVMEDRGGMHTESLLGTIAAFSRRYCPILFCGSERYAARVAFRILSQPVDQANRLIGATKRAAKRRIIPDIDLPY